MASASNKLLLGCFVPMSGPNYLIDTINMALECGANCFMFYTGSPQTTMRTQIKNMNVEQFHKLCIQNNITKNNIVVHAPYIINLATSDTQKQKFAKNFLQNEIDRVNQIGAKYLVVHPGNATNNISIDEAITNCANLINSLDCKDVILCIETMSGKGTEIGKTFLEVKDIINLIKNKKSIGVCLDTCHTWDSGYDWNNANNVIKEFDTIIGLDYLKCIHINDSLNICGAKKDRHANIGYGKIGFVNLLNICYHKDLISIPKILETPIYDSLVKTYKTEISMLDNKKFIDWMK